MDSLCLVMSNESLEYDVGADTKLPRNARSIQVLITHRVSRHVIADAHGVQDAQDIGLLSGICMRN